MFKVKRFVTGHDATGVSNITFDDHCSNVLPIPGFPGAYLTEIWTTEETPVDNSGDVDRGARAIRHDPTPGGTIFRVVEIPTEASMSEMDTAAAFEAMGSANVPDATDRARHPSMHFTNSVDYIVVMQGEMHMIMEDGEVLLRQGDVVVQRGTKHAWSNRGTEPCIIAAILVDAHKAN